MSQDEPGLSPRLRGNHGLDGLVRFPAEIYGLSPRLRGNLVLKSTVHRGDDRSIPAPAGEPVLATEDRHGRRCPVYPRACGGTMCILMPKSDNDWHAVYPRACGGTLHLSSDVFEASCLGLSPRLRGNRFDSCTFFAALWSGLSPRLRGNQPQSPPPPSNLVGGLSPRLRGNP